MGRFLISSSSSPEAKKHDDKRARVRGTGIFIATILDFWVSAIRLPLSVFAPSIHDKAYREKIDIDVLGQQRRSPPDRRSKQGPYRARPAKRIATEQRHH